MKEMITRTDLYACLFVYLTFAFANAGNEDDDTGFFVTLLPGAFVSGVLTAVAYGLSIALAHMI